MRTGWALVAVLLVAFVPAASAAPADSPGVLRAKLADAIVEEQRAVALLKKKPPRKETAALALDRSAALLDEIRKSGGFGKQVSGRLDLAQYRDSSASDILTNPSGISDPAGHAITFLISEALQAKQVAMELLRQPATAEGAECADGKDNDADGLVDGRHDSGCTSKKDDSERSPLTCDLELTQNGLTAIIEGTCSGPFSRIEISAPSDSSFDTKPAPIAGFSHACRYPSASKLDCLTKDGLANPRHAVSVRLRLTRVSVSGLRVVIKDFASRRRAQTLAPTQPTAPGGAVDPVSARCAARFDFSVSRLAVRCDGVDVKSSSVATGGPVVSAVTPADAASAGLSRRCEPRPVSGSGLTAARCLWNAGNKGQTLSFQFAHDRALGAVTIHVLAGGSGEEGTTIVLRQTWRPLEGFLCQQSIPPADSCATP